MAWAPARRAARSRSGSITARIWRSSRRAGNTSLRLGRWEQFRSQAAGGSFHLCMTPQPWLRTGPGLAKDGKPKFDLSKFDPAFFDRLRERVIAAGTEG